MDSATDCCGISYKKEFVLRTPKVPPMAPHAAMFEKVFEGEVLVVVLVVVLGEKGPPPGCGGIVPAYGYAL